MPFFIDQINFDQLTTAARDALVSPPTGTVIFNTTTGTIQANYGTGAVPSWEDFIPLSQKGAINGVAELDGAGHVPTSQLPLQLMEFKGNWNAATNTPTLSNSDISAQGNTYRVCVAGAVDFGAGLITFAVGDWVFNDGAIWDKGDNTDAVASVFGRTGTVTAQSGDYTAAQVTGAFDKGSDTTDNITQGTTNLFNQTHTGDVTGATALTIGNNKVTNAKSADMAAHTIKLRNAGSTGDPQDVKVSDLTEVTTLGNGDWIMVELSTGELRKISFLNLKNEID